MTCPARTGVEPQLEERFQRQRTLPKCMHADPMQPGAAFSLRVKASRAAEKADAHDHLLARPRSAALAAAATKAQAAAELFSLAILQGLRRSAVGMADAIAVCFSIQHVPADYG